MHNDGVGAANSVSRACQQAHACGIVSGRAIRQLLARAAPPPPTCGSATSANAGLMVCGWGRASLPTAQRGPREVSLFPGVLLKRKLVFLNTTNPRDQNLYRTAPRFLHWNTVHQQKSAEQFSKKKVSRVCFLWGKYAVEQQPLNVGAPARTRSGKAESSIPLARAWAPARTGKLSAGGAWRPHGAQAHTCSVEAAAKRVHERARPSPAGHSQLHVCAACSPRCMRFCAAKQAPSRRIRSSAVLLRALLRGRNRYARSARRVMVPMPDSPDHVVSCSSRLRPRLCRGSRVRAASSRRPAARVCIRCVSLCGLVCKSSVAQAPRPCAGAHAGHIIRRRPREVAEKDALLQPSPIA